MAGKLTRSQDFLLSWLGKEDFSAYGECRGADLDALVSAGFAKLGPVPPRGEDYRTVELTHLGRTALAEDASRTNGGGDG